MKLRLLALVMLVALAGCAKKEESGRVAQPMAELPASAARGNYLAYEHSLQMDAEEHKVGPIFEAAQAACREAASELCTVLESRIGSGRTASATLKFRAKPAGIRLLVASLSKQAQVTEQSTTAEDLAGPIEDTAKKLAMLNDYRSKLEALRARANTDVDALIKVNRELAQVQSELEENAGKHAHLVQRVETEILNVSIDSRHSRSFWRPIGDALSDFGTNLSQGASIAITGVAFLIPWAALLLLLAWVGRALWRRWKRPA